MTMMKGLLFIIVALALPACKKERECFCKSTNTQNGADFSNKYTDTKRKAKITCEYQHKYWSPDYTCELK